MKYNRKLSVVLLAVLFLLLAAFLVSGKEKVIVVYESNQTPVITRFVTTTTQSLTLPTFTTVSITTTSTTSTTLPEPTTVTYPVTTTLPQFNNQVSIKQPTFTNCQCLPTTYTFNVTNTGQSIEHYTFKVEDLSEERYYIDRPKTTLEPGQSAVIKLTVMLPCQMVGTYEGAFVSIAQDSGLKVKRYFYLNTEPCFDYNMVLGKYQAVMENQTLVGTELVPVESLQLCTGENTTLGLRIQNQDFHLNTYQLQMPEQPWVLPESESVTVEGNQDNTVNITLAPDKPDAGSYNVTFAADPLLGLQEKEKNLSLEVANCYRYSVSLPRHEDEICATPTQYNVTVENMGPSTQTINLEVIKPDWASLSKNSVTLSQDSSSPVVLTVNPPDKTASAVVRIYGSPEGKPHRSVVTELTLDVSSLRDCYQIWFNDRQATTYYGEQTPRFEVENIGQRWASYRITGITRIGDWVQPLTREVNLSAGEQGYIYLATDAGSEIPRGKYPFRLYLKTATGQEYSEQLTVKLTERGYTQKQIKQFFSSVGEFFQDLRKELFPTTEEKLFHHQWQKNQQYAIDLSQMFYDPDLDQLEFTVSETEHIHAEIKDTKLVLTPEQNWTGKENLTITADDGKGGVVTTPNLTLVVS